MTASSGSKAVAEFGLEGVLSSHAFTLPSRTDPKFPPSLGAVVQNTVLLGEEPARVVIHTPEGDWCVGDGVNEPNAPGACTATHISHAVERNSSIATLASMPIGHIARRADPGVDWEIHVLTGWGE